MMIDKELLLSRMSQHNKNKKFIFDDNDKWGLDNELFDFIYKINKSNDNIITTWSNMGCKGGDYDGMMISYDANNYVSYLKVYLLDVEYYDKLNELFKIIYDKFNIDDEVLIENNKISYRNNKQQKHILFWEELTNQLSK